MTEAAACIVLVLGAVAITALVNWFGYLRHKNRLLFIRNFHKIKWAITHPDEYRRWLNAPEDRMHLEQFNELMKIVRL